MTVPAGNVFAGLYEHPLVDPQTGVVTQVWYDFFLKDQSRTNRTVTVARTGSNTLTAGTGVAIAGNGDTVTVTATGASLAVICAIASLRA